MVKRDFIRNILLLLIVIIGAILLRIFVFQLLKVSPETANTYLKSGDLVTIKKIFSPNIKILWFIELEKKIMSVESLLLKAIA